VPTRRSDCRRRGLIDSQTHSLRHCLLLSFDSSSKHLRCRAPPSKSQKRRERGDQAPSWLLKALMRFVPVCHDASHKLAIDTKKVITVRRCVSHASLCTVVFP
jgi:hypothetical protein